MMEWGRLGPPLPRTRAAMQQVAEWLEKLGMSEYAHRFVENCIDFALLPEADINETCSS
jgi:hypothetical protein